MLASLLGAGKSAKDLAQAPSPRAPAKPRQQAPPQAPNKSDLAKQFDEKFPRGDPGVKQKFLLLHESKPVDISIREMYELQLVCEELGEKSICEQITSFLNRTQTGEQLCQHFCAQKFRPASLRKLVAQHFSEVANSDAIFQMPPVVVVEVFNDPECKIPTQLRLCEVVSVFLKRYKTRAVGLVEFLDFDSLPHNKLRSVYLLLEEMKVLALYPRLSVTLKAKQSEAEVADLKLTIARKKCEWALEADAEKHGKKVQRPVPDEVKKLEAMRETRNRDKQETERLKKEISETKKKINEKQQKFERAQKGVQELLKTNEDLMKQLEDARREFEAISSQCVEAGVTPEEITIEVYSGSEFRKEQVVLNKDKVNMDATK